jgi:hypothetical protein
MVNPPVRSTTPAPTWPIALNLFWFLLILIQSRGPGEAAFITLFVCAASLTNVLGALIALLQRKWRVAAWYGLGLLFILSAGAVALTFVDTPLYQDE